MKPYEIRRWIHRISGSAALVLIATGALVTFPDFRDLLIGGNGQFLSDIHLWIGLIFISGPLLALWISRGSILDNLKKRVIHSRKIHWRRIHLTLVLCAGMVLGLTGPVMWMDSVWAFPVVLMDAIFTVHLSSAWLVALVFPVHLFMARKGIARVLKSWFGLDKKPLPVKAAVSSSRNDDMVLG